MMSYVAQKNQGRQQESCSPVHATQPLLLQGHPNMLLTIVCLLTWRTLPWARHQGSAKLEILNPALRQAGLCLESVWDVRCSDTHVLHTRGVEGLWKRQLLVHTLFSNVMVCNRFYVPCFLTLCQVHTFKLHIFIGINIYVPCKRAIIRKPESHWPRCLSTTFSGNKCVGSPIQHPAPGWLPTARREPAPAPAQPGLGQPRRRAQPRSWARCGGAHHEEPPSAALQASATVPFWKNRNN